jgi:hypothetical protein
MNKEFLYRFTSRLYSELKNPERNITLKKLRGLCGLYDYGTEDIWLDYRREIVPSLIHEILHHFNPDKCETWISNEESKIINSLSLRQIKNIIKAFADSL